MTFYSGLATTALNLLTSKGQSVTINRYATAHNTLKGRSTRTLSLTDTAIVVMLPASKGTVEGFDNRAIDGELAKSKIRFLIAAASGLSFVPLKNDEITGLDGEEWRVLGSTPINPAGTPLVYRIGVSKA